MIGAGDLIVGVDRQRLGGAVETAFRRVDIQIAERGADIVDVETIGRERLWIELDAHRWPVPAADADEATPVSCEIFCASRVSLKSSRSVSASVFDVTDSVSIGASAGFTLA